MSGVTTLVDTILATRLAQRVDLVPLRSQLEVGGPEAVTKVEQVANDVRLPSREALQQQLGLGLLARGDSRLTFPSASPDGAVTLSVVARTVSAILYLPSGESPKIHGSEPLWPHLQPPVSQLLATTLEGTVATSGLFYESHLQQYADGTRTLEQLAQEPQARLQMLSTGTVESPVANLAGQGAAPTGTSRMAEAPTKSPAAGPAMLEPAVSPSDAAPMPLPVGLAASLDPTNLAATYGSAGPHDMEHAPFLEMEGLAPSDAEHSGPSSLDSLPGNHPVAAVIHPDAVALVRQQLEFLALPVFRWGGEVFPGTPMDWDIREERDESHTATGSEETQRTWATHLVITLPTLKVVDVRLSLAGATLQVHLAARENATLALLSDGGNELTNRLGGLGIKLTGLQIGELTVALPARNIGNDDGAAT